MDRRNDSRAALVEAAFKLVSGATEHDDFVSQFFNECSAATLVSWQTLRQISSQSDQPENAIRLGKLQRACGFPLLARDLN
jgi:hypothetical protein